MIESGFEPLGKLEECITMSDQGEFRRLERWTDERARTLFLGAIVGFFVGGFFASVFLVVAMVVLSWLGYLEISL